MIRKIAVYLDVFYGLMTVYRAEVVLWAIATALPLIMMGVWVQAGATGNFPLDDVQMARYFVGVFIVRQLTVVWVIHDFEWHVVSGRLSPHLLRPIDPGWGFMLAHISEQLCRLPIIAMMLLLCVGLFPAAFFGGDSVGPWLPSWWQVILSIIGIYCAFLLRFVIQYTFAIFAFWLERVSAAHELIYLPYLFLSGMVAPLEVFPEWLRQVVMFTPFPYMVWFPARLLVDGDAPIMQGFAVMLGWTGVLWVCNRWLWRRGLKHYSAMGA